LLKLAYVVSLKKGEPITPELIVKLAKFKQTEDGEETTSPSL